MKLSYCGIDCEKCIKYKGRGAKVAKTLLKMLEESAVDEWIDFAEKEEDFEYNEFKKGLKWVASLNCLGCQEQGDTRCSVWRCASERKIKTCKECPEFPDCDPIRKLKEEWGIDVEANFTRWAKIF